MENKEYPKEVQGYKKVRQLGKGIHGSIYLYEKEG